MNTHNGGNRVLTWHRTLHALAGPSCLVVFLLAHATGIIDGFTVSGADENAHVYWESHTKNVIAVSVLLLSGVFGALSSIRLHRAESNSSMMMKAIIYLLIFINLLIVLWSSRIALSEYISLLLFGPPPV